MGRAVLSVLAALIFPSVISAQGVQNHESEWLLSITKIFDGDAFVGGSIVRSNQDKTKYLGIGLYGSQNGRETTTSSSFHFEQVFEAEIQGVTVHNKTIIKGEDVTIRNERSFLVDLHLFWLPSRTRIDTNLWRAINFTAGGYFGGGLELGTRVETWKKTLTIQAGQNNDSIEMPTVFSLSIQKTPYLSYGIYGSTQPLLVFLVGRTSMFSSGDMATRIQLSLGLRF